MTTIVVDSCSWYSCSVVKCSKFGHSSRVSKPRLPDVLRTESDQNVIGGPVLLPRDLLLLGAALIIEKVASSTLLWPVCVVVIIYLYFAVAFGCSLTFWHGARLYFCCESLHCPYHRSFLVPFLYGLRDWNLMRFSQLTLYFFTICCRITVLFDAYFC